MKEYVKISLDRFERLIEIKRQHKEGLIEITVCHTIFGGHSTIKTESEIIKKLTKELSEKNNIIRNLQTEINLTPHTPPKKKWYDWK